MTQMTMFAGRIYTFTYLNWKGITRPVRMRFESVSFGKTTFHSEEPQWFINGHDMDRNARRSYVVLDIQGETLIEE